MGNRDENETSTVPMPSTIHVLKRLTEPKECLPREPERPGILQLAIERIVASNRNENLRDETAGHCKTKTNDEGDEGHGSVLHRGKRSFLER
jgi:hypothetical protein